MSWSIIRLGLQRIPRMHVPVCIARMWPRSLKHQFFVNGNDPLAVAMVAELALEYRQKFQEDVVIDINCYRKHGHNEADDPAFTQPILYQKIKQMPSISAILTEQLVKGWRS